MACNGTTPGDCLCNGAGLERYLLNTPKHVHAHSQYCCVVRWDTTPGARPHTSVRAQLHAHTHRQTHTAKVKQTTIDSLHRHTVVSRQKEVLGGCMARLQNLKSMHAQRGASKAVSCERASCDRGESISEGQDGARQVRCGALLTGVCLQGGGRPESHHSRLVLGGGLDVLFARGWCVGVLHAALQRWRDVLYRVIRSRISGRLPRRTHTYC